ncbi:hypothetical protein CA267_017030 [Alteromonas pelagimontana]|uniref:Uncharacterized protein n=1 Tax=Alteromonas pelagimontana TaxID=1858656 RepID=A0A6M4MGY1_9ALTE|nr:hypothetical protein [Alteromonas pelagimontana]QJR82333.1 hypothetical protein CA267_017030 [Alteromonas pelagimontana]
MSFDISPITIINLTCLIVYSAVVRRLTSFTYVMVGIIAIEALHQALTLTLMPLANSEHHNYLIFSLWYLGFAFSDFLCVGLVILGVKYSRQKMERASKFILGLLIAFGVFQVVRYIERLLIDSEFMGYVYAYVIVAMNYFVSLILVIYIGKCIYERIINDSSYG